VGVINVTIYPSLRFGMTKLVGSRELVACLPAKAGRESIHLLREFCINKEASAFPVSERNDVVILSSPPNINYRAGESILKGRIEGCVVSKDGHTIVSPLRGFQTSSFDPGYNCDTPTGLGSYCFSPYEAE
jgi:hypothetical protein